MIYRKPGEGYGLISTRSEIVIENRIRKMTSFFLLRYFRWLWLIAIVTAFMILTSGRAVQLKSHLPTDWLPWNMIVSPAIAADEETAGTTEGGAQKGEAAEGEVNPCPECPKCPDPAEFVLQGLEARKETLRIEEEALKDERKALESYKEQIDENLEKLEALKKQIAEDLDRIQQVKNDKASADERAKTAAFEKKMSHMAAVYAKMDPEKAGAVLGKMDIKVASEIISRIAERKASKLFENINEAQAAKISERLAHKVGDK